MILYFLKFSPAKGGKMAYNEKLDTPYIRDEALIKQLEKEYTGKMEYTLVNDFLAKYGLQKDLYALKGLLAALLEIDIDSITDIQILNPIEPSKIISDKECILDIKLEINNSKLVNIEIQNHFQDFWPERAVTYMCRMFDNLEQGQGYDEVKPCIHIGILNCSLVIGKEEKVREFFNDYRILNTRTCETFTEKFVIKELLLNNLENATKKQKEDNAGVYYWAKLFKAKTWEEMRMIAQKDVRMKSLVNTASKLSGDRAVKEACEARSLYTLEKNTYENMLKKRDEMIKEQKGQLEIQLGQLEMQKTQLEQKDMLLDAQKGQLDEQKTQLEQKDMLIKELQLQLKKLKSV